jgi:hypothetical protein
MFWIVATAVLGATTLVVIDRCLQFPVLRFVFGIGKPKATTEYGDDQGYSTLVWLLGIILTSGATFAASLQFNRDPFIPILVYAAVSLAMLIGVGYVLSAKKNPTDTKREFTYGTILFGRWVQTTLIVLALASVTASFFGALPGQEKKESRMFRKPFLVPFSQLTIRG